MKKAILTAAALVAAAGFAVTAASAAAMKNQTTAQILPDLTGTYACSQGKIHYKATWTSMLGGTWLSGSDGDVDNIVSYNAAKHQVHVVSIDSAGRTMLFEGPANDPHHVVIHEMYPSHAQTTTYDQLSSSSYKLTFQTPRMHGTATCTK